MKETANVIMGDQRRSAEALRVLAAGSVAGMASTMVCHPLDTVRTRLQTSRKYRGALHCVQETASREGLLAFYKGLSGPLMAQAVYKAVMFGAFGLAAERTRLNAARKAQAERIWPSMDFVFRAFSCGLFAGTVNSFFVTPIELVRNRLMIQYDAVTKIYRGPIDCVIKTVRNEPGSIFALWKGISIAILRDGPGVGIWFASFEMTKHLLAQGNAWDPNATLTLFVSGAVGGVGFWLVALPFDVIKSNVQVARTGEDSSISYVVRKVGIRGLYKGLGIALVRGIPGAGVVFVVQKRVLDFLSDRV